MQDLYINRDTVFIAQPGSSKGLLPLASPAFGCNDDAYTNVPGPFAMKILYGRGRLQKEAT